MVSTSFFLISDVYPYLFFSRMYWHAETLHQPTLDVRILDGLQRWLGYDPIDPLSLRLASLSVSSSLCMLTCMQPSILLAASYSIS